MGRKMRTLLSVAILAVAVSWIVLSYLPSDAFSLPQFHYAPDGWANIFPGIVIGLLLLFIALQIWVVRTTAVSVRRYESGTAAGSTSAFRLIVRRETILTALPIVFTVLLAVAVRGWWQSLIALN